MSGPIFGAGMVAGRTDAALRVPATVVSSLLTGRRRLISSEVSGCAYGCTFPLLV
jgi:hypothetical protein